MSNDERQFLLTAAWMFMRHGQPARARAVCAALVDDNPRTQKQVADAMGISQSYISRIEKRVMKQLKQEMLRMQS